MHRELIERHVERHPVVEQHELSRDPRLFGVLDQRLPAFRLLDFTGAGEQRVEIAIFGDQLCRSLDADAGYAGHVVDAVAGQCLHFDNLVWRDAEFLDHLGDPQAAILHGVVHGDLFGHQLHQILVGGYDGGGRAALTGFADIGRNQVVGLETALFDARQVEGADGVADQRELRDQVVRRRRPVRFIFGVKLVAEGHFRLVEDDRQMRRPVVRRHVPDQLPQHVAEAQHCIHLQPVGFAVQRRQCVIGAKNIGRAVDQKDVVALRQGLDGGGLGGSCF